MDYVILIAGFAALLGAGHVLVRAAIGLAALARISPTVVGLTVVAMGTSMPELVVSVRAAIGGNPDVALGNVVGSNIFNIAAVVGVAALIRPLHIRGSTVVAEWPVMFLALCLVQLLCRDGSLDRVEAAFLLLGLAAFIGYAVRVARRDVDADEREQIAGELPRPWGGSTARAWVINAAAVAVGGAGLALGADLFVDGAVGIATAWGVSERVIGLTVVSVGTSLPELSASVIAARHGHDDMAVANVIGSNIFNCLGIAGATAAIHPVAAHPDLVAFDGWWMLGFGLLLLPLMYTRMQVSRVEGAILLAGYCVYVALLIGA